MKNPPHPGEVIREEVLRPFALSITKAAAILGVRRAPLSDLIRKADGPAGAARRRAAAR